MSAVYYQAGEVLSSVGWNLDEHMKGMLAGRSGLQIQEAGELTPEPLPMGRIDRDELEERFQGLYERRRGTPERPGRPRLPERLSPFEMAGVLVLQQVIEKSGISTPCSDVGFILSSTKGNIEGLNAGGDIDAEGLSLWSSAARISGFFGFAGPPVVISNACISGVVALLTARRMIAGGKYSRVVVLGADLLSPFIVSGFRSFKSLSSQACRPYDRDRDGLSLGEAAAAMLLGDAPGHAAEPASGRNTAAFEILGGAISNDANHISGPSRTGEGLFRAIRSTLALSGAEDVQPDLISAHGTATPYNDEMEAIALERARLSDRPLNSLKGYLGHTLGAAGVVESLLNLEAMRQGILLPTPGFRNMGVSHSLRISSEIEKMELNSMLKVASGFGGCNAALLFRKSI